MLIEEECGNSISSASTPVARAFDNHNEKETQTVRCRQSQNMLQKNETNNKKKSNEEHCESCKKEQSIHRKPETRRRSSILEGIEWFKKTYYEPEYIMEGNDKDGNTE